MRSSQTVGLAPQIRKSRSASQRSASRVRGSPDQERHLPVTGATYGSGYQFRKTQLVRLGRLTS